MILGGLMGVVGARDAQANAPVGKPARQGEAGEGVQDAFSALLSGVLGPVSVPPVVEPAQEQSGDTEGLTVQEQAAGVVAAAVATARAAAETAVAESGAASGAPGTEVESVRAGGSRADASVEEMGSGGVSASRRRSAVGPESINRSLAGVAPVFGEKLDRVIERMRSEGHSVRVNETLRSQVRQEELYAQGRTRPGPVVTWTLNSNHKTGRAADLVIDGSYDNPAGYERLAEIAAEEGLRTLGPKDPGHVELPRHLASSEHVWSPSVSGVPAHPSSAGGMEAGYASQGELARSAASRVADPSRTPGGRAERVAAVAPVAEVAPVASVASVAPVARVAEVARVGESARARRGSDGDASEPQGRASEAEVRVRHLEAAMLNSDAAPVTGGTTGWAERVGAAGGTDMVSRLSRILEMKDGPAGAGSVNHVTLRLDNGTGGEDRIRVDVRRDGLGATIEAGSLEDAARLRERLPDLKKALERQGLDPEALTIRTHAQSVREAAEMARVLPGDLARATPRQDGSPENPLHRERWHHPAEEEAGKGTKDPHSRSRREHKGGEKP